MPYARVWIAALLFVVFLVSFDAIAADHEDGPTVKDVPQADILDYFVFPSADGARLVLAMTLVFDAETDAKFASDVSYRFRIREGKVMAEGHGLTRRVELSAGDQEDVIACSATKPNGGEQKVGCVLNPDSCGDSCLASEVAFDAVAPESLEGLRVFAGLVRDPFFSDVFRVRTTRPRDRKRRFILPKINPFKGHSVLAVVVEVPLTSLKFEAGVLATVAETLVYDKKKEEWPRVDRMGNVEVTNFVLCFRPIEILWFEYHFGQIEFPCPRESETIKDSYNSDDAFAVHPHHKAEYEPWFSLGLKVLDHMDSDPDGSEAEKLDWPHADSGDGTKHPFVDLFVNSDWLMVDTRRSCSTEEGTFTYLDIEMSAYLGEVGSHQTCGGRTPNEDVIDKTLTLFINGPDRLPDGWWGSNSGGTIRSDRVDKAHTLACSDFPWLVPWQRPCPHNGQRASRPSPSAFQ